MARYPNRTIPIILTELAVITAADGKDLVTIPFSCTIFDVHMKVGTTGSSSGNNDVTVYYTAPTGGVTSSGDLWTVASGVGRIAYNASVKYLRWAAASCAITKLEAGGTLSLNVDAVAGAGSPADLTVILNVYPAAA